MSDLQFGYAPQTHRKPSFGKIRQDVNVPFVRRRPVGQNRVQCQKEGADRPAEEGRGRRVVLHAQPGAKTQFLQRQAAGQTDALGWRERQVGAALLPQVRPGWRRQGPQPSHRPPQPQPRRPARLPAQLDLHQGQRAQPRAQPQPQPAPFHRQAQG